MYVLRTIKVTISSRLRAFPIVLRFHPSVEIFPYGFLLVYFIKIAFVCLFVLWWSANMLKLSSKWSWIDRRRRHFQMVYVKPHFLPLNLCPVLCLICSNIHPTGDYHKNCPQTGEFPFDVFCKESSSLKLHYHTHFCSFSSKATSTSTRNSNYYRSAVPGIQTLTTTKSPFQAVKCNLQIETSGFPRLTTWSSTLSLAEALTDYLIPITEKGKN